ncbi:MAG: hypothetical protein LAT67_00600 [Balneolales bacterium]|nr:hypothetical protein [Balneolales bacterium]
MAKEDQNKTDRKEQIEEELKLLETKLGQQFEEIKTGVEEKVERTKSKLRPAYWIKRYPAYCIGAAVALGFMIAPSRKKNRNQDYQKNERQSARPQYNQRLPVQEQQPGIFDIAAQEIKHMLTRKTTDFLMMKLEEQIDKNLSKRKKE